MDSDVAPTSVVKVSEVVMDSVGDTIGLVTASGDVLA